MLAMKEEVGIGFDFSQRILHGTETSRRCARREAEAPNPNGQSTWEAPTFKCPQNRKMRAALFRLLDFEASLGFGTWRLEFRACAALARLADVITGRL